MLWGKICSAAISVLLRKQRRPRHSSGATRGLRSPVVWPHMPHQGLGHTLHPIQATRGAVPACPIRSRTAPHVVPALRPTARGACPGWSRIPGDFDTPALTCKLCGAGTLPLASFSILFFCIVPYTALVPALAVQIRAILRTEEQ